MEFAGPVTLGLKTKPGFKHLWSEPVKFRADGWMTNGGHQERDIQLYMKRTSRALCNDKKQKMNLWFCF